MPVALAAALILLAATAYRLRAVLGLMHEYSIEDYDANPAARRLMIGSRVALVAVLGALLALSYCTGLWWVKIAGWLVCIGGMSKLFWAIELRRSRKYRAYYAARFWK